MDGKPIQFAGLVDRPEVPDGSYLALVNATNQSVVCRQKCSGKGGLSGLSKGVLSRFSYLQRCQGCVNVSTQLQEKKMRRKYRGFNCSKQKGNYRSVQTHEGDTGSPEVQVALLTNRINSDRTLGPQEGSPFAPGSLMLVGQRRRFP